MKFTAVLVLSLLTATSASAASKKPCPCPCPKHRHHAASHHETSYRHDMVEEQRAYVAPAPLPAPAPAPRTGIWNEVVNGFSVTSGFRWDRETVCPSLATIPPSGGSGGGDEEDNDHHHHHGDHDRQCDPFFIGAELRLPLNQWADLGGNLDRDWTEAPHWDARVYIAAHPWRK